MNIGLLGLPQAGKKTLFGLLTGEPVSVEPFTGSQGLIYGKALIRDERFDRLVEIYQPQKSTPASLDIVLLPGVTRESLLSGECLKAIEKCDALCLVVRGFQDETVFHVDGSVDVLRDIDKVLTELILSDLLLVEKRLERLDKEVRIKAEPRQIKEQAILQRMKAFLDDNQPLSTFPLDNDEVKIMATYQFLTRRPLIIVLNVGDDDMKEDKLLEQVRLKTAPFKIDVIQTSAKIEAEISSLSPEERQAFYNDLNISDPALNALSRHCFDALGLISFFTCGPKEVRHWNVSRNASAPQAAGVIHSDMERGFIRAEIIKFDELMEYGSEAAVKAAGKMYLKGKDYVLQDGDIMFVRFNV